MAADPRIILGAGQLGNTQVFQNILGDLRNLEERKQRRALMPIEQQLAQTNLSQQGEVLTSQRLANDQQRQRQFVASTAQGAADILPGLESGDFIGVGQNLSQRFERLKAEGLPTETTEEAISLLDSNPGLLTQRARQAVDIGRRSGLLGGSEERRLNLRERELEQRRELAFAKPEIAGKTEAEKIEAQRGRKAEVAGEVAGAAQEAREATAGGVQKRRLAQVQIDETKARNAQARADAVNVKNIRRTEAGNAVTQINSLLKGDRFSAAFGRFLPSVPESLRPQRSIDVRAEVDQVVGLLTLESREKLKGQGTITDSEAKTLGQSSTTLGNPRLSMPAVRKELRKIRDIFEDAEERNRLMSTDQPGELASPAGQPQVIRFDAQGNIIQ